MTAHSPDLLGEYLVLCALQASTKETMVSPNGPQRVRQLAHDAWHLSPNSFHGRLIRLRQDFPDHALTNMLAEADIAQSVSEFS
jgi:hypothetical protein